MAAAAKNAGREGDAEASVGFARPCSGGSRWRHSGGRSGRGRQLHLRPLRVVADRARARSRSGSSTGQNRRSTDQSPGNAHRLACDDRDFIVTSLNEELHRLGHRPTRLVRASSGRHRDPEGHLVEVGPARGADEGEAFLEIELEGHLPAREAASVLGALRRVLDDVVSATSDYPAMRRLVEQASDRTRANGRLRFDPESGRDGNWASGC